MTLAVRQRILLSFFVGFVVPLYWGAILFVMFSASGTELLTRVMPWGIGATCPPCVALPGYWVLLAPLANGALFAVVSAILRLSFGRVWQVRRIAPGSESDPVGGIGPGADQREKRWLLASAFAGLALGLLFGEFSARPTLLASAFEYLLTIVVLGAFAYVALGLIRIFAWTATTAAHRQAE